MLGDVTLQTISTPRGRWMFPPGQTVNLSALLAGGGAMLGGGTLLKFFPRLELEVFARAAAWMVGLLTGTPVFRGENGWITPLAHAPIEVTSACSATDYFVMVAGLISFQLVRRGTKPLPALFLGLGAALPVTIFVNALRIITVAYAHPGFISRLPPAYESFLHMTVGAAVFLPALIALNLLLETYARPRRSASV